MSWFICLFLVFSIAFPTGKGVENFSFATLRDITKSCSVFRVDPSGGRGGGNFTTIQAAIDSVPQMNEKWVCIRIKAGVYNEKLLIPYDKPFVYLQGSGKRTTRVVWDGHTTIEISATIISQADNVIAKSLTFVNSYNYPFDGSRPRAAALAALIQGDKSAFYRVGFLGVQDTLWDCQGRHYFERCTIQGSVDFIFGSGQSFYQSCTISVLAGVLQDGGIGYITAQGRSTAEEKNGFVFKDCVINGYGKTYLGRPWRDHARVIFYNTLMSSNVVPRGWDTWGSNNKETVVFNEFECRGAGSDKTQRVSWSNRQSKTELLQLTTPSYIDASTWLYRE